MRAGRLRNYITIQRATRTQNSMGEWVTGWSDWWSGYASIEPNTGRRYYEAQAANSEAQGIIRLRHMTGVLPTMRALYGNRVLRFLTVVHPREDRRELHVYYKEDLD